MENDPVGGSAHVHVDLTTSLPHPAVSPVRQNDAELIAAWASSLRAGGYATSSIEAATKRLESFARRLPAGLLKANKQDIVAFYEYREALAQKRRAEQQALGLRPARMVYLYHPTWANFLASAKQFYAWAEQQALIGQAENPLRGIRE
jgi:hypothetical protein